MEEKREGRGNGTGGCAPGTRVVRSFELRVQKTYVSLEDRRLGFLGVRKGLARPESSRRMAFYGHMLFRLALVQEGGPCLPFSILDGRQKTADLEPQAEDCRKVVGQ